MTLRVYFESINHDYLRYVIDRRYFYIHDTERFIIEAFVSHRYASLRDHASKNWSKRSIGVPQGCSLSLFLANIAAHELDKQLERLNGSFVRYADDIVAVAHSYADVPNIVAAFRQHCDRSGIALNDEKSPGIALLIGDNHEMEQKALEDDDIDRITQMREFDYIGYKFSMGWIGLSSRGIG